MIKKIIIPICAMLLLFVSLVSASGEFELLGTTENKIGTLQYLYSHPRVIGDVWYVVSDSSQYFSTWNISNVSNIVLLDEVDDCAGYPNDVAVKEVGNEIWAWVVVYDGWTCAYNVTDPSNIGNYIEYVDNYGLHGEVIGDILYTAGDYIATSNISKLTYPTYDILDSYDAIDEAYDMNVQVRDSGIYLFTADNGLTIYNVTDPTNIYNVSRYWDSTLLNCGQGLDVVDDIVYYVASCSPKALAVFNISDISNPVIINYLNSTETSFNDAYDIRVYEDIGYVANFGNDEMMSWDLSDPYNINLIDTISGAGNPNWLKQAYRIYVQDNSRIFVHAYGDHALTLLSHCGTYTCINYDTCQPDVTGGYISCTEVISDYCTDEQYQNNDGDYSEFQTSCNYCTAEESESVGECEINPETEYQSYRKYYDYVLTNNETCCALTGNNTDCDTTEGYWESCGISGITGDVVANDPVYIATSSIIYAVLVIAVIIFILIGAVENMKGKGKGELIK